MIKIAIVDRYESDHVKDIILAQSKFSIVKDKPDYVFSIGGDGTFLRAVKEFGPNPTYITINTGTLGFYANWLPSEVNSLIENFDKLQVETISALEVTTYCDDVPQKYFVINETTLISPVMAKKFSISINDNLLENFNGSGVCITTASGSTGFNKSLGGSIIPTYIEVFQLTEIAGVNNSKFNTLRNSIILSKDDKITIQPKDNGFENTILTFDTDQVHNVKTKKIEYQLSAKKVKILKNETNPFWKRVKTAFIND